MTMPTQSAGRISVRSRCVSFLRDLRKAAGGARRAVSLVAASAVLAGCQVAGSGGGAGVRGEGPTQIALLVPYGSSRGTDTTVARSLENAARLAVADLGGAVELNVYPTQGSAGGAQQAVQQALGAGAQVILGPLYGDNAAAVGVAAAASDVPVLSFSNNTTVAGGNVWVLGNTFENIAQRLLTFAASQGRNRVLVTHNNEPSGQLAAQAIARGVSGTGAQITGTVAYQLSEQGIAAAVPTIAAQTRATGSNAVFLTGNTASDLPILSQRLTEAGIGGEQVRFLGLARFDIPAQARALPGLQGGYFTLPDPGPLQRFEQRYRAAYGAAPHPIAGLAYDGVAAIGAISREGRVVGRRSLTDRSGFAGTGGAFRLLPDGSIQRSLAVAQIVNRQVQVVSPAPNRFGPGS